MVRNMTIAAEMGYLEVPPDTLVDVRKIDDLPDDRMVLMCTGSQGEPMAALSRIANRDHRVSVGEGDVVIKIGRASCRERRLEPLGVQALRIIWLFECDL